MAPRVRHVRASERDDRPRRSTAGGETASVKVVAPGSSVVTRKPEIEGRLPEQFFGTFWGQASFAAVVGLVDPPRRRVRVRLTAERLAEGPPASPTSPAQRRVEAAGPRAAEDRRRPLPRDRERPRQVQALATAPARARAGRPAAPHGRVRLPDARRRPPGRPRRCRYDAVGAADRARPARRSRASRICSSPSRRSSASRRSRTSFPTSS